MATTPTVPSAAASAPAAAPAPASTPAASTPATSSTPATPAPAAQPAATQEPKSLEQALADKIRGGFEPGDKKDGAAAQPESETERRAREEAAAATAEPGEPATAEQPKTEDQQTPEAEGEADFDDFAPDPTGIGPKDLAAKLAASPELKAAIDANPEVRDMLFANARLAAKAKPYVDMFGSVEEAQAVQQGHQQFAQIRNLMGSVKRDDVQSTQAVINAMLDADAMRDEDGNPLKDENGQVVTAGNTGRFLRNFFGQTLLAAEAAAKQSGDNEMLAAIDLLMERKGFRASSSAGEGEDEGLKAERDAIAQERRQLDERKASEAQETQKAHDTRVYDQIDAALDKSVDSILERATGLTEFARKAAQRDIRAALRKAIQSSPAYQTELDAIERMPVGAKREKAHVALATRYIQAKLRNAALPILTEAGITLSKKAASQAATEAARAESARSEVRSTAPPARNNAQPGQPETTEQVKARLRESLKREPTFDEVMAARIAPAFQRRTA